MYGEPTTFTLDININLQILEREISYTVLFLITSYIDVMKIGNASLIVHILHVDVYTQIPKGQRSHKLGAVYLEVEWSITKLGVRFAICRVE